jgi:hypothetical protein
MTQQKRASLLKWLSLRAGRTPAISEAQLCMSLAA